MIKILKNMDNWKYLIKYGVGEVLLVVIGILIALQINNWNESKKQRLHEIELVSLLITDLNDRKAENVRDREYGLGIVDDFKRTLKYWKENADIDTTGLKKVLELLAGDNWYYHNETPTYKRLSNSTLWERIPDTLATQINNIYYTRFTVIKIRFEKTREYAASCKLNYLRPNGLINLEQTSADLKKKVLVDPVEFISYLELLLVNIQRLNTVFQQSKNSIEEVVKKLYIYKNNL
tara:strand:- start:1766 stop:2470 length:705 start_codon:yes stop_codon:yes gene_type:complete